MNEICVIDLLSTTAHTARKNNAYVAKCTFFEKKETTWKITFDLVICKEKLKQEMMHFFFINLSDSEIQRGVSECVREISQPQGL